MICPNCNAQLPNEARFCPTCGTPVQQPADRTAAVSVTLGAPSPEGFQPTAGPLFPVDTRLDTFVITGVIGRGGSGDVYEAVDDFDGSTYALKVIPDANERAFVSIRDEFAARKRINDFSHIVRAYQPRHVESPSGPIVVFPMERLASSLSEEIRPLQAMSEEQREETILTTILPDILAGLRECHRAGILHLDMKPRNILYDRANQVYKVTDFGISRFRTDFGAGSATEQPVQGTIAYAAPEQLSGGDLDERTDVYALGILLTTLFYGLPTPRYDDHERRIDAIVETATARNPRKRFQSIEEILVSLNDSDFVTDDSARRPIGANRQKNERAESSTQMDIRQMFIDAQNAPRSEKPQKILSLPTPMDQDGFFEFLRTAVFASETIPLETRNAHMNQWNGKMDEEFLEMEAVVNAWRQVAKRFISYGRDRFRDDATAQDQIDELERQYEELTRTYQQLIQKNMKEAMGNMKEAMGDSQKNVLIGFGIMGGVILVAMLIGALAGW